MTLATHKDSWTLTRRAVPRTPVPSDEVLDPRVYRTAFLPALVALFVAAFALEDRPDPARSSMPADSLRRRPRIRLGGLAHQAVVAGHGRDLQGPHARARSTTRASRTSSERCFKAPDEPGERAGFTRPAHRDALQDGRPGDRDRHPAGAVGAADRRARPPRRSRARGPLRHRRAARARARAQGPRAAQDARARLDLGLDDRLRGRASVGARGRPAARSTACSCSATWPGPGSPSRGSCGWPASSAPDAARARAHGAGRGAARGPQRLRRPARARASGSGARCRSPSPSRDRSAPRACPPCCSRSPASSARPPASPCSRSASAPSAAPALSTVGAIDADRPRATAPAFAGAPEGIVTLRNVLPDWGARLVVGSLLLPALLAALDAFFRARRRRVPIAPWIAWLAVAAVPLPVAWLWLRAARRDRRDRDARRPGARRRCTRSRRAGSSRWCRRWSPARSRAGARGRWPRSSARRAQVEEEPAATGSRAAAARFRASTVSRSRPGRG